MCRVSVIVPTHNRAPFLPAHLEAVLSQNFDDYEAIYVNDSSRDETADVLAKAAIRFPNRLRVVSTERGAPGPARNAGAQIARGELLLFTDDDVSVPNNWIAGMLEKYAAHGCEALCGGIASQSMASPIERYLHFRVQGALGKRPQPIGAAPMMNFMVSRALFERIGGFSDDKLHAAEDWEFCHRITAGGARIQYDPSIEVTHQYQREWGPAMHRMRDAGASGVTIWLKHHRGAFAYTAYALLRCILSPFWIPFRYPMDLYALAVRMEYIFAEARLLAYLRARSR